MSGGLRVIAKTAWAGLGALAACAALSTWFVPWTEAHASRENEVRVAGALVLPDELARGIAQRYLAQPIAIEAEGTETSLTRAALGARVDETHLALLLTAAGDRRSALRRMHPDSPLTLPMPARLDPERATPVLLALKDRVDRLALEARIDPQARQIIPARPGVALDVYATLARIELALHSGQTRIAAVLQSVPAQLPPSTLDGLELDTLLGEFETSYRASAEDRSHNLELAASKIDGYVLQPGATFDFNAVVGGRSAKTGFRPAPVIADGELAQGMGGGTCQIASTLHAAVFFAGLPILSRVPHTRPSFYIKLGLDATVVFGAQNFVFKNDRDRPLVIGMSASGGRVHATLHGVRRDRTVTFVRHIDSVSPFEERTTLDATLPRGLRVLVQRGVPGFKITRERVITDPNTGEQVREQSHDSYPPTTQLWRAGTGPEPGPGFVRPRNDPHPEYVADEHFELSQDPSGNFTTVRDAGRTGSYGWTATLVQKD